MTLPPKVTFKIGDPLALTPNVKFRTDDPMTLIPKVKIKTIVSFPAAVFGGTGIAVRQDGGRFYFDLDYAEFEPPATIPAGDLPNTNVLTYDVISKGFKLAAYGGGGSSVTPSTANPLMDGIAVPGVSVLYTREDHVHPTDTSRVAKAGDTMTGLLILSADPVAALGAASKQYVDSHSGGAAVYVSDTPPAGAPDNSLWWESDTGLLFVRYNDGVGAAQWVMAVPVIDATAFAVRFDAAQSLTVLQQSQARANIGNVGRNRVTNGQFRVDQVNAGAVTTSASHGLMCDMWRVLFAAGSITAYAQQATTPQSNAALQISLANTKFGAVNKIENRDCVDLRGKAVVASATITPQQATLTNFRMAILEWTGTADAMTNPISAFNAAGTNPTLAASWNYLNAPVNLAVATGQFLNFQVTGTVGASMNNLAVMIWSDGANAISDYFFLTDVQLEQGSIATVFDRRSYAEELVRCQRYAWTWAAGGSATHLASGGAYATNTWFVTLPHPVVMRTPPTGIVRSADAAWSTVVSGGTGTVTGLVFNSAGPNTISLTFTSTATAGFFGSLYGNVSTARLNVTGAEL